MKSTIEKDKQVFQQVTAELEAEGFFDRWLGQVSNQPIASKEDSMWFDVHSPEGMEALARGGWLQRPTSEFTEATALLNSLLLMKLQDFQKMIDRTLFCASSGIVAPRSAQWRGGRVYLEKSGGTLFMAASNNIQLGFASRKVGDSFPDFEGIMVAPEVLQKIAGRKRGSAPLNISIVDKKARFQIGSNCVSAELLSGEFHKFYHDRRELPGIFPLAFSADRTVLLKSLGALSPAIDRYSALSLTLSPEVLTLQTGDEECSAEDDVPCDYAGAQTTLIFHVKSFTEIIEHIDTDRVTVRFNSEKLTVAILPEPERDYLFFIAQRKRS